MRIRDRKLEAAIFDLDGLMVDTEPLYHQSLNLALSRCGVPYQLSVEEYGRVFVGADAEDGWFMSHLGLERAKISAVEAAWDRAYEELIGDPAKLSPMPGLVVLLDQLCARGLRLGVASSTARERVQVILQNLNLDARFHTIVCGSDVENIKPAPDVYLRALAHLCVPASRSVAIEDSAAGIAAAKAAGLHVIAVPNRYTAHQDLSRADERAEGLEQLIDLFD